MQIYRVGGAVRDKLLGLPIKDHDWVVVGATPELMKKQGYQPVGRDFPVFLHPKTKEEYALARTERKSGHGYAGFTFHTASDISLEEDLLRRDLTINAMAEDGFGHIIDPYGGQKDLENRLLRHVSTAFQEDPLRILRVARFAARLNPLGFRVARETLELMKSMVSSGEAAHLVPERVWQETFKALMEPNPAVYFQTLERCGALEAVMPELSHFIHNQALQFLNTSAEEDSSALLRFSCLFIPSLPQTESERDENLLHIQKFSSRLHVPTEFSEQALLTAEYSEKTVNTLRLPEAESLMSLFEVTDALRRPERFEHLTNTLMYCFEDLSQQKHQLIECLKECLAIKARDVISENIKGKAVGEALRRARVQWLETKNHPEK
ncbi:hypothetical protein [Endozoicomonas sp.]|uniref:hypothetical protein n=1 Tax=Endozoicomonas sp. TaxID=1892382 RepID=UPI00383A83B4